MASREQVVDKAARIFGAVLLAEVLAALDEYGIEEWQRERERVQMGILRLCMEPDRIPSRGKAEDNTARLYRLVKAAQSDYRDILLSAEYPHQAELPVDAAQTDAASYKAAVKADRQGYLAWLNGESGNGISGAG